MANNCETYHMNFTKYIISTLLLIIVLETNCQPCNSNNTTNIFQYSNFPANIILNSDNSLNTSPKVSTDAIKVTTRRGRSTNCGKECVCEGSDDGLMLVDCSRAQTSRLVLTSNTEASRGNSKLVINITSVISETEVRLVIMGSELTSLESLGNTSVTRAHLKYNPSLSYISMETLEPSLETLKVLDLRNNNLTNPMTESAGKKFKRLQFLSLDDNRMKNIPKWINNTYSLVHLSLANNLISDIGGVLDLPFLQFLNLQKNSLSLAPSTDRLSRLRSLILKSNPITSLPKEFMEGLKSLEYLDLSYTELKQMTGLFAPTPQPWLLNVANTPLEKLPSNDELVHYRRNPAYWVDLRGTKITTLEERSLKSLLEAMARANVVHADWGKPQLWINNDVLSCDCSAKWLATNSTLLKHISGYCVEKHIELKFMDPDYFNVFCY